MIKAVFPAKKIVEKIAPKKAVVPKVIKESIKKEFGPKKVKTKVSPKKLDDIPDFIQESTDPSQFM